MAYNSSCGCNSGCNTCQTCPQTNPCAPTCLGTITQAQLGELVYLAGLDINLCPKYSTIIAALGLVDCAGNPIVPGSAIVTCGSFQSQLCSLLQAMAPGATIAPGTILIGNDCTTHVMPAFQTPLIFNDTTCITLDLTGNVVTANPVISPTTGNTLSCTPGGLYSNVCVGLESLPALQPLIPGNLVLGDDCAFHPIVFQPPLSFNGSDCIDVLVNGNVITVFPIISPDAGNQLECTANGLYVSETVVPPETPITPVDTNSVNLTASGTANHTLQADVIISPTAGNATSTTANGVYTPDLCTQLADVGGLVIPAEPGDIFVTVGCEPRTIPAAGGLSVLDTQSIDLTLVGTVLSADVEISSVPDNILELRPDGLAVRVASLPGVTITGVDTPCFDVTVNEAPDNTFTITGAPIVSPTAGNQLACSVNGLFVAPQATPAIAPTTTGFPAGCNGLEAQVDGLAAPPNSTGNQGTTFTNSILVNEEMTTPDTVSSATFTINIENPSDCRDAVLVLEMYTPQIATSSIQPGVFAVGVDIFHSFNLPGILVAPMTIRAAQQIVDNDTAAVGARAGNDNTPSTILTKFVVPPGFVGSYSVMCTVTMFGGTGTVLVANPAAAYFLYTI